MRITLLTCLLFSQLAYAQYDCEIESCQPCFSFDTYFTALIFQPSSSNLDYAAEANPFNYGDAQPAVSPSWSIEEISPGYHFGFDIGIIGSLCQRESYLALNWVRYHSPNDNASDAVISTSMVGPFFEIGPDASLYHIAKGSTHFHFDAVNFDYGSYFSFCNQKLSTNFFAGIGFMRLLQNLSMTYADNDGDPTRTISVPAKFIGAGPQLGFGFDYQACRGVDFVGGARATLFVGNLHNETTYSTASNTLVGLGDQNPNFQTTSVQDRAGVVPGFETNLGLATALRCLQRCLFRFEAGYRTQIYLSALRSIDMGSEVTLNAAGAVGSQDTGVYARTFLRNISDFALFGPYLSVAFTF